MKNSRSFVLLGLYYFIIYIYIYIYIYTHTTFINKYISYFIYVYFFCTFMYSFIIIYILYIYIYYNLFIYLFIHTYIYLYLNLYDIQNAPSSASIGVWNFPEAFSWKRLFGWSKPSYSYSWQYAFIIRQIVIHLQNQRWEHLLWSHIKF